MISRSNIFKIASVYTSIILGAGFVSGQELVIFFVRYGTMGFIGLLVAGFLFSLVGGATLLICHKNDINSYGEFITHIMGQKMGIITEWVVAIFLFVIFATMLSAGGSAVNKAFEINKNIGVMIIALLALLTFMYDLDGMVGINMILAPIMVIGGLFIGIYTYFTLGISVFSYGIKISDSSWLVSAILYSSYNIIMAVSVLSSINHIAKNSREAMLGGIIGGGVMTILGLSLFLPMNAYYSTIQNSEIPIYDLIQGYGDILKYFYLIILILAIFTTAVANGFAFIEWISGKVNINKTIIKLIVVLFAILGARVGFSNLVQQVYPVFGYIGIIQIVAIVIVLIKQVVYKSNK